MNNKKKKIIAIVVPIVLILLIVLAIVLVVVLPKDDNSDNTPCVHSRVYSDYNDEQHKITCSKCTEYIEYQNHSYENDQATKCSVCEHTRVVEIPEPEEFVYPYTTPSGVVLSSDKTELKPGSTFTMTMIIATTRKNVTWSSFEFTLCPLSEGNEKEDATISSYFEFVDYKTSLDGIKDIIDSSSARFDKASKQGMKFSFAILCDEPISAEEPITITLTLKVKDTAPDVEEFDFGVTPVASNYITFKDENRNRISDRASSSENITINTIAMSISSKAN